MAIYWLELFIPIFSELRASLVAQLIKTLPAMWETGFDPWVGEQNGYPLQYSGLENPKDCIANGVTKSWTRLSNFTFTFRLIRRIFSIHEPWSESECEVIRGIFSIREPWSVSECKVAQSCLTLQPHDSSVHGIFQARILEWLGFPSSRGSSQPRDQTQISHTADRFFTSWATREAQEYWSG